MRTPGLSAVGRATGGDREPADLPGEAEGVLEAVLRVPGGCLGSPETTAGPTVGVGGAIAAILSSCSVLLICAFPRVTRKLRRRRDQPHASVWQTEGDVFPSIADRESDQRLAVAAALTGSGGEKREAEGPGGIALSGAFPPRESRR